MNTLVKLKACPTTVWLLLVCGVILSISFVYPFSGDNAQLLYTAFLMLHGVVPYSGVFFHDLPGVLLIHAFQILLLGRSLLAFHVLDIVLQLIGAWLLYHIAKHFAGNFAGWSAALFSCFYYVAEGGNMIGQRDTYVSILLLGATYFLLLRPVCSFAWPGLLVGLTVLFRPTYGLPAVAFFSWLLWRAKQERNIQRVWSQFLPSAVAPVGIFLLLSWAHGILSDVYEQVFLFNVLDYNVYLGPLVLAHQLRVFILWIAAFAVGETVLFTRGSRELGLLLAVLVVAEIIEVLLLSQSNYQLHPLITFFILGGAIGWGWLWNLTTSRSKRLGLVTFVLAASALPALRRAAFEYVDMSEETAIIRYLKPRISPGSYLQTTGALEAPLELGAIPASPFIMIHGLVQRNRKGNLEDFQLRWRSEFLHELEIKRPIYFLMHDGYPGEGEFLNGETPRQVIRDDMPDVGTLLDTAYHIETHIGRYTLYRRNDGRIQSTE